MRNYRYYAKGIHRSIVGEQKSDFLKLCISSRGNSMFKGTENCTLSILTVKS